jgi:hypothetical protein
MTSANGSLGISRDTWIQDKNLEIVEYKKDQLVTGLLLKDKLRLIRIR